MRDFFLILLSAFILVNTANTNDQDDDDLDTHAEDDVEEEGLEITLWAENLWDNKVWK